jgi:hypothetical protein
VGNQLLRWVVELNLPQAAAHAPRWQLTPPRMDDLKLQLEIDRFFAERGLPVDEAELYARYGRKKSEVESRKSEEKTLNAEC